MLSFWKWFKCDLSVFVSLKAKTPWWWLKKHLNRISGAFKVLFEQD